jgi:hypothetical protein
MLDAGCRMPDAGCWMLDAGCWMLDAGCWMLNNIEFCGRDVKDALGLARRLESADRESSIR